MKKEIKQGNTMIHSEGKMVSERLVWEAPVLHLLNQSIAHADSVACPSGPQAAYGCGQGVGATGNCQSGPDQIS